MIIVSATDCGFFIILLWSLWSTEREREWGDRKRARERTRESEIGRETATKKERGIKGEGD